MNTNTVHRPPVKGKRPNHGGVWLGRAAALINMAYPDPDGESSPHPQATVGHAGTVNVTRVGRVNQSAPS